jgi:hypothetical protein
VWLTLAGVVLVAASVLHAADLKETARTVAEQAGKSIITIRVVSTIKVSGQQGQSREQEQKSEATGVIIDPSGITVACGMTIEPPSRQMFGQKREAAVKETTFIMPDGTEIPAEIVLKDTDLDLVFLRPKETGKAFDAVGLKSRPAGPKVLDDVFCVGRLSKEGNRALRLLLGEVQAEVKGPRTFYVCSPDISRNLGCLVFAADGEPIGIIVTKTSPPGDDGGAMMGGGSMAIMRPVSDVLDSAKQAKEVKAKPKEEGKKE